MTTAHLRAARRRDLLRLARWLGLDVFGDSHEEMVEALSWLAVTQVGPGGRERAR